MSAGQLLCRMSLDLDFYDFFMVTGKAHVLGKNSKKMFLYTGVGKK